MEPAGPALATQRTHLQAPQRDGSAVLVPILRSTALSPHLQPPIYHNALNAQPNPGRPQSYEISSDPSSRAIPPHLSPLIRVCHGRFGDPGRQPRGRGRRRCGAPSSTSTPLVTSGGAPRGPQPPPSNLYPNAITSNRPPRPNPPGSANVIQLDSLLTPPRALVLGLECGLLSQLRCKYN